MIRSMDTFLSEVNSRKAKRRRMLSLLLGLSMVVTSGVSWALHGVGLTLANEAECGIGEHIHTDDCYERQLVCGLEENDTHTHDESCYEMQLVCGQEEHIHDTGCFTAEDDSGRTVTIRSADAADATDDDGASTAVIIPKPVQKAPGDPIDTVETIDNIAEGIKFTLFDYGGSELESQNNNYIYRMVQNDGNWVPDGPPYAHENISYTGINTGRDALRDILFLAYGTPVPRGAYGPVVQVDGINGDLVYNNDSGYQPDKNSYSGDYDEAHYYSGNRPVSGIVASDLGADGYPVVNAPGNHSLAYLFAPNTYDAELGLDQSGYKTVYQNVNHLLQRDEETGHLFYNSNDNYAYYNQETGNFEVYNQTFEIINDNHHREGDINNIKFDSNGNPIQYATPKDPGFMIGFFPFDQYDDTRKDPNYDGNGYDHHFGMTMEAEFTNPVYDGTNVKEPITFKYSGDDDMWVFVDGKLVLDIGGIHEPTGGMIDFSNGIVWTQDNGTGKSLNEVRTQLEGMGIVHSDAEWEALPKPIGIDTASTSTGTGNKWIVRPLSDFIPGWDSTAHTQSHKINMFYLERGGCYSNLAMEMNLPTLKPLTVIKNVDYQQHLVKGLYEDLDYTFQVWEWDKNNSVWVRTQSTAPGSPFYLKDGHFTLKDGERKTFEGLGQDRTFKVVEEGVDPNIIGAVTVNGSPVEVVEGEASPTGGSLKELNSYTFNNQIIEETEPLRIRKVWEPENAQPPPGYDKVKYKILRTDSVTGEVKQVALVQNGVKVRTFVISAAEWAQGVQIDGLLSRYGDHIYTYEVEELNVPKGFKASYGTDASGALVITNTDVSKMDIFVKKEWENTEEPEPKIKLRLTRERAEYEGSTPTSLTIRMLDEAGNLLREYTTNEVFANGGAEFSFSCPDGAEYYGGDPAYPQQSPDSFTYKIHDDEGIITVENLADTPNTLTFKVRTADAADSLLVLHHSFSDADPDAEETVRTQGWTVQNPAEANSNATATFDGSVSYGKDGGSLLISNRVRANNAAVLRLDPAKFNGNKTYTFSAYVYSPIEDRFKMTFNNGLGGYQPIGEVTVPANTWTQLTGTIQLSGEIDPYNMALMIESLPVGGDYTNFPLTEGGTWFRVDEFTAIEGTRPVTVSDADGTVTVDNGSSTAGEQVVYEIRLEQQLTDGWQRRGNPSLQFGNDFIRVYYRNADSDGLDRRFNSVFQPGHTYQFRLIAQHDDTGGAGNIHMVLNFQNTFKWLCNGTIPYTQGGDAHEWAVLDDEWTIPADADPSNSVIYFETNNDTRSYRVKYLRITDVTPTSSAPSDMDEQPGYDIVDGRYYVSNFDLYQIAIDENSVTDPVHLKDEGYSPETGWMREIILPDQSDDGESWTYHWDNDLSRPPGDPHYIYEDHEHYLYKYHIEEIWIDHEGNELHRIHEDEDKWVSADEDYVVTYLNNGVATNDADNPIIVKNTYIWYRLPETGGMGTDTVYGAGLFLITTGLIGGYAFRRRERRFR